MGDQAPPLTAEQKQQAQLAAFVAARSRDFQAVMGLPVSGKYDAATGPALAELAVKTARKLGNTSTGKYELTGSNGERYHIGADGKIYEFHNGKFDTTSTADIRDLNHPATAGLMSAAADTIALDLKAARLRDIDTAQKRLAMQMAGPNGDADAILKKIKGSSDEKDAGKKLMELPGTDRSLVDHFLPYLWNLDVARGRTEDSNYVPYAAKNSDLQKATIANDLVHAFAASEMIDTMANVKGVNTLPVVRDFMFDPGLERQLRHGDAEIEIDGKKFSREEVRKNVIDRFESAARDAGVAPRDISKAMFEGRFNPDLEDIRVVYESLSADRYGHASEWNRRFGSLKDMGEVTTRVTSGRDYDANYKVDIVKMNTDQVMMRLAERTHLSEDQARMSTLNDRFCAFSYFDLPDLGAGTHHLTRDYAELRNHVYYPVLQNAAAGISTLDVGKTVSEAERNVPVAKLPEEAAPKDLYKDNGDHMTLPIGGGAANGQPSDELLRLMGNRH